MVLIFLIPLDILPLSTNKCPNLNSKHKADFVKDLHDKVRATIERKNE